MSVSIDSLGGISSSTPSGIAVAQLSSTTDWSYGVRTYYYDLGFSKVSGGPFTGSGSNLVVAGALTQSQYTLDVTYGYKYSSASGWGAYGSSSSQSLKVVIGLQGNDALYGTSAGDLAFGNDGNDTIAAGAGNDTVNGNAGNDSVSGQAGDDSVRGGKGDDYVWGETGNDSVYGDFGADTVSGGAGNDVLHGGRGNDIMAGHEDDDELWGDKGDDTMGGGTGQDKFYFTWHDSESGHDVIDDFDPTYDTIALITPGESYGSKRYEEVSWRFTDSASGVIVNLDDGNTVLLKGVSKSSLASSDYAFYWQS
jgi:Ca2+-binding RTX toxin-like protein